MLKQKNTGTVGLDSGTTGIGANLPCWLRSLGRIDNIFTWAHVAGRTQGRRGAGRLPNGDQPRHQHGETCTIVQFHSRPLFQEFRAFPRPVADSSSLTNSFPVGCTWARGHSADSSTGMDAPNGRTQVEMASLGTNRVAIAAAVNDDEVLGQCLAASPDIASGALALGTYRGYASASRALNAALDESTAEWVMLVHQDVYLPAGFLDQLLRALSHAEVSFPSVGVCGVIGMTASGEVRGQTWSSGLGTLVGRVIEEPMTVATLDEMILIVRRPTGLRFDDDLPGFHLYGTDIVLSAQELGLVALALPLSTIHHSKAVVALGADYAAPYDYLRRKWWAILPAATMMGGIRRNPMHRLRLDLRARRLVGFRRTRPIPAGTPREIALRVGYEQPKS